jgi:hypothetical protein
LSAFVCGVDHSGNTKLSGAELELKVAIFARVFIMKSSPESNKG